jgi:hypothetical protein
MMRPIAGTNWTNYFNFSTTSILMGSTVDTSQSLLEAEINGSYKTRQTISSKKTYGAPARNRTVICHLGNGRSDPFELREQTIPSVFFIAFGFRASTCIKIWYHIQFKKAENTHTNLDRA